MRQGVPQVAQFRKEEGGMGPVEPAIIIVQRIVILDIYEDFERELS